MIFGSRKNLLFSLQGTVVAKVRLKPSQLTLTPQQGSSQYRRRFKHFQLYQDYDAGSWDLRKPIRILAFGDSYTAGTHGGQVHPYGVFLQQRLRKLRGNSNKVVIKSKGLPDKSTQDLIIELDKRFSGLRYAIRQYQKDLSVVLIQAGTQDLFWNVPASRISANLLRLHELCYQHGVPRTVALGIPPSAHQDLLPHVAQQAQIVNDHLAQYAQTNSNKMAFLPFPFPYMKGDENWYVDGIHLSKLGYQRFGEYLAPFLHDILSDLEAQQNQEPETQSTNKNSAPRFQDTI
jgi:lysophospholipase L1-like esterase